MVDVEPTDDCGCNDEYIGGGEQIEYVCGCIQCPRCDDWRSKEEHPSGEFSSSGVCHECTCDECGKRIETDDLNDVSCEPCMDIIMAKKDARTAEGWCYECDEEKAVERYIIDEERGMGIPVCLACLAEHKQTDRAWDVFVEQFGREPNMAEYVRFGLDLEDDDFQKSLPEGLE
jgi:hypothetical protein